MWTNGEVKGKILHKLTRLGKFKHSHTSIDNLPKEVSVNTQMKEKIMNYISMFLDMD